MKTVALIEENWGGHRGTYCKIFAKTLLDLGCQVIALCPEPIKLREWIVENCSSYSARFYVFEFNQTESISIPIWQLSLIVNAIDRWRNAKIAIESIAFKLRITPDLVFFPWLDSYLAPFLTHHLIDLIFPYKWSGLYFHPTHLRLRQKFGSLFSNPFKPDIILKSSYCRAIAILDEGITKKLQSKINNKPVITLPDFTDTSAPNLQLPIIQEIQRKAKGRKIIGLLGLQGKRKGLLTLLKVARKTLQEDYFFVFAGQFAAHTFSTPELTSIKTITKGGLSNCFFHLESLPDEASFNALVNTCDILFAAYENFPHSSNILTKAAVFEKPVIVSKKFCMAERVEKFQLGLIIDEGNVSQCIEAIFYLCRELDSSSQQVKRNFEDYRNLHSERQLKTKFSLILDNI